MSTRPRRAAPPPTQAGAATGRGAQHSGQHPGTTKPPAAGKASSFTVLYEQAGVIVVDKPAGRSTSGRSLDDADCVQADLIARERRMVWAVHQLDRDTSGVNVFVARRSLVPVWQTRLRFPNAHKTYVALVHGAPSFVSSRVDMPIGYIERRGFRGQGVTPSGQPAATRVQLLGASADGRFAAVACTLETGRTHQIRVHLAAIGHPVVGDPWYADPPCALHHRHALHALSIVFADGTMPDRFDAPLPDDLRALAVRLGVSIDLGVLSRPAQAG